LNPNRRVHLRCRKRHVAQPYADSITDRIRNGFRGWPVPRLPRAKKRLLIPINESADDKSQIGEYLHAYKGEGIQHPACGGSDVYATVEALQSRGFPFMPSPPATYYERVDERVRGPGEDLALLARNGILLDGEGAIAAGATEDKMTKVLLQIFSATAIGPIFFEFIQWKGDEGFGHGNFRALFLSIEEDHVRRGVMAPVAAK
jgi:4-hydroxyphenylpyruvate dioxygenase